MNWDEKAQLSNGSEMNIVLVIHLLPSIVENKSKRENRSYR